jgi:hypothetical protein
MAETLFSYLDYLKEAFHRKLPIPFLGSLPMNKMLIAVFGVAGIANPGFWLLGLAAEAVYLFGLASNGRFQKLIQAERLMERQRAWAERLRASVERLAPENRDRYRRLVDACRMILGMSETLQLDSLGDFRDLRGQSLNQLLAIFLKLLLSRELIASNLKGVDRKSLEAEVARLEQRLGEAASETALARSLHGTLDIQRKRLDNRARAEESLAVVDAELERIEQQVALLHEEGAVSGKPELLSDRLDAVAATMSETSRWMEDNAELLGSLGGDPLLASGPGLPEVPALERTAEER